MSGSANPVTCACGTLIRMIERGEPVDVTTPCPDCGGTTQEFGVTTAQVIDVNQSIEARSFHRGSDATTPGAPKR